uniref:Uncharacterized protein n=1 Tax=Zooxanthella nutricula TaxID=1333877 RepID=A0A7S2HYJ3_9DINO
MMGQLRRVTNDFADVVSVAHCAKKGLRQCALDDEAVHAGGWDLVDACTWEIPPFAARDAAVQPGAGSGGDLAVSLPEWLQAWTRGALGAGSLLCSHQDPACKSEELHDFDLGDDGQACGGYAGQGVPHVFVYDT